MSADAEHAEQPGRDRAGRFVGGHAFGAAGGRARAERLSPERRREIARAARRAQLDRRAREARDGDSLTKPDPE